MTMRLLLPVLLLAACAADDGDADHDGFPAGVDCADDDPFVYPGAPDDPGDGLDADCEGGDPPYAWLGDWELTEMTATYAGLHLFVEGSITGSLAVVEDATVDVVIAGTLNPDVIGSAYDVTVNVTGTWSPMPGPDSFALYAEGLNFGEQMHVALDCVMVDDALGCGGELKALEISMDAEGTYARP